MAVKLLGGLGVEPLEADFDPQVFHAGLRQRNAPIKQVLLGIQDLLTNPNPNSNRHFVLLHGG